MKTNERNSLSCLFSNLLYASRYFFDAAPTSTVVCSAVKKTISPAACFQEADTDDQQGTLTYEEFSVFYKMMSLRRDVFLLMMAYSDRKDHLTAEELANFLRNEQKVSGDRDLRRWHSTLHVPWISHDADPAPPPHLA